jgi:hypothetical protein
VPPLPSRDLAALRPQTAVRTGLSASELRDSALDVLLAPSLAAVVDLVCWPEKGLVHVADSRGHVALAADGTVTLLAGRNPVADQDPFSDDTSAYPFAAVRLHSLFSDPRAPGPRRRAHRRPLLARARRAPRRARQLNGVQSARPAAAVRCRVTGARRLARVARNVDVGATLPPHGRRARDMDGAPARPVSPGSPHVVGPALGRRRSARPARAGREPARCRTSPGLLDRGCALRGGAIASSRASRLVNHTCALTGVGPGRHGIVNNAFYDRALGEQVVPNASASWHRAMDWMRPGRAHGVRAAARGRAQRLRQRAVRHRRDVLDVRAAARDRRRAPGSLSDWLPPALGDPHATQTHVTPRPTTSGRRRSTPSGSTRCCSCGARSSRRADVVEHHAHRQRPPRRRPGSPIARASMRTPTAGSASGSTSSRSAGCSTTPSCCSPPTTAARAPTRRAPGDWDDALAAAGIPFRDEAYGFLYLGEDVAGPGADAGS